MLKLLNLLISAMVVSTAHGLCDKMKEYLETKPDDWLTDVIANMHMVKWIEESLDTEEIYGLPDRVNDTSREVHENANEIEF